MHTRITEVSGLTAAEMQSVMDAIGDRWLANVADEPGFRGYSVFGSPASGRGGLSTLWSTPEAMHAGETAEEGLRDAAMAAIGYRRTPVVETYELVAWGAPPMSPQPEQPVRVRLGRVSGLTAADLEPVRDRINEAWLPHMSRLRGFLGYSVFGNRETGKGGMSTLWSGRETMILSQNAEERVYREASTAGGRRAARVIDSYEMLAWSVPTMAEAERLAV
jgi:hypothetical protein